MIPTKVPAIIKRVYPRYVWNIATHEQKKIYLTFDDGPIPEVTEFIITELQKYQAKATFFCIGNNIKKHPEIFKQILMADHAVGNHTMNHLKAWKTSNETYHANVSECQKHIEQHLRSKTSKLFRPPYGQISTQKLKALEDEGYKIILWDVLAKDWIPALNPSLSAQKIIKHTESGSIIVFHDSLKAYQNLKQILPIILSYFTDNGYRFEKIEF